MPHVKKASDNEIMKEYEATKSIYATANKFGMCAQNVHARLAGLGIVMDGSGKKWKKEDKQMLHDLYRTYRNNRDLKTLAKKMGRTKHFICKQARQLGLTDISKSYSKGNRTVTKDGYIYIGHSGNEHRAVMEAKLGRTLTSKEIVHHKDEDRSNNEPSNLEVTTMSRHMAYHSCGERSYRSKLTWAKVRRIREFFSVGILRSELASTFSVSWTTIDYVVKNKTWKREILSV